MKVFVQIGFDSIDILYSQRSRRFTKKAKLHDTIYFCTELIWVKSGGLPIGKV